MKQLHCLNPISKVGLNVLSSQYALTDKVDQADAILVRSAVMHDMALPEHVIAVARAGAGVNNIPLEAYAKKGIVVFNTPGANANAVKELILAGMFLSARNIHGGMNWVRDNQNDPQIDKTVEKAKSAFGGTEIFGKTLGIVGLGAIGILLAKACVALGMKVYATTKVLLGELPEGVQLVDTNEELYPISDYLSLNLPLIPETKHMIRKEVFEQMKDGAVLLNFARDALVRDEDLEAALQSGKIKAYVTDFPNAKTAGMKGVLAIPHLGASTEEAEDNCAVMACHQLMGYIEEGTVKNSVNYPDIALKKKSKKHRIQVLHDVQTDVSSHLNRFGNELWTSKNAAYAISVIDTDQQAHVDEIRKISGVHRVRII